MRNQDLSGIWDFVQTFEGEPTTRFTAKLKANGEIVVDSWDTFLKGVYQINASGDQMSLSMVSFHAGEQKITTYLGDISYEGVFGRVKEVDMNNQLVSRGTWGAAILSKQLN
jgi:hypothetical protein